MLVLAMVRVSTPCCINEVYEGGNEDREKSIIKYTVSSVQVYICAVFGVCDTTYIKQVNIKLQIDLNMKGGSC